MKTFMKIKKILLFSLIIFISHTIIANALEGSGSVTVIVSPQHCVGSWDACSGGSQTYTITTVNANGGNPCPYTNGATQSCGTAAYWNAWSACSGGSQSRTCTEAAGGGAPTCATLGGASTQTCGTASVWSGYGTCSGGSQSGTCTEAIGGGAPTCATRGYNAGTNTQTCGTGAYLTPTNSWNACSNGSQTRTCTEAVGGGVPTCATIGFGYIAGVNTQICGTTAYCSATHYGCSPGTSVNNSSNTSTWTWGCDSTNGGVNAPSCSETKPAPGAWITASPASVAYNGQAILSWGSYNTTSCTATGPWSNSGTLSGSGWTNPLTANTTFSFQCTGNGQTSILQSVTVGVGSSSGSCGSSNGMSFYSSPTSGYCSAGTASSVSGSGPWNWSCAGANGGSTASCSANKAIKGGWTDWSAKNNSCGYSGTQTRTCTNPTPAYGGSDCSALDGGNSSQSYTNTACVIAGGWTAWSAWSACSASCGGGTQSQTRTCTNPVPSGGGADCSGSTSQSQSCNTGACACSTPLNQNVTVACAENVYGDAAISGLVTRSQTKSAYPGCTFPVLPVTVSNSTYVSDNCVYPPSDCPAPLTKNVTAACDPKDGYDSISGSVTRSQVKSAYPGCTFPALPITNENSVYVSDNCGYPSTSGELNASPCTILAGEKTCTVTLDWNISNPVGTSTLRTPNVASSPFYTSAPGATSGTKSYPHTASTTLSAVNFYLVNNGISTSATSTVSCVSDYHWDGSSCVIDTPGTTTTFTAGSSTIFKGKSTTLTWDSPNATSCTGTGTGFNTGVAGSIATIAGSVVISPTTTTTYTLSCTNSSGTSVITPVIVKVINLSVEEN
jgi:hypothetical protein